MEQTRRMKEKEVRKKSILDAAETLFLSNGFKNTRIEEIMAASQFSKRTIYQYFGSKEEILIAVTLRKARELQTIYEETSMQETLPLEKIRTVIMTFIHFFLNNPAWYELMKHPANLESVTDLSGSFTELTHLKFSSKDLFEHLLNEAKKDKSVPAHLDTRMSAQFLIVATMGILQVTIGIDARYWEFAHIQRDKFLRFSIARLVDSLSSIQER